MGALDNLGPRAARPQSEPVPGKGQVQNSAGGYVFAIDKFDQLRRFLILGTDGGTYYASERELTRENALVVLACLADDPKRTIDLIVEVSDGGLAPRNDQAIFALAAATSVPEAMRYVEPAFPKVVRIGTHLFQFVRYVKTWRGWGPALRRMVGNWYADRDESTLAFQLVKYRNRHGYSHRDVLRLAHPDAPTGLHRKLYDFACGRDMTDEVDALPYVVEGFIKAQTVDHPGTMAQLIRGYRLPREAVPTPLLSKAEVQSALLEHMPLGAVVRNLGAMTASRLLAPGTSTEVRHVVDLLADSGAIRRARLHPLAVLLALATYRTGRGVRGKLTWTPVPAITNALDEAFRLAFTSVEPSGKRFVIGLDVSGSMGSTIADTFLSAREASAAMAMVTTAAEAECHVWAFTSASRSSDPWARWDAPSALAPLDLSARRRLDDVITETKRLPFGRTDCALPMLGAAQEGVKADAFVIYTDNETWNGKIHPFQALQRYREQMGIDARLVVVGMTSTGFSIADPSDPGMLDVVGFDASAPALISAFAAGKM